ncbi:ribosome biogenesis GTP-binding protein YihA/YsxC [Rickettsia endosymbiont of Cardiosporidium cionae]|uniref:ribosome biogenesis GTP-binding protein YihA/YsxC n=1 Tax=Rickettsia endosymbiont of Cardiosporidium cionae TaxID=2777155 RepID=UPI001893ED48|nr:ribosome biogenesis GTP-binding protein YihA/YsxC [Rickettsia endosymbiont of Cardiosporidium cionae]KAF8818592.1 GTP-binding protein [Rickettsia endosymbiont of Cardiosporidium cionae]
MGKNTIFNKVEFIFSIYSGSQSYQLTLPQIVFIGKSNVGKSTLINNLCYRKSIARVSSTPGCTKAINFFLINEQFLLVDPPGYGYAKTPNKLKNSWKDTIYSYLDYNKESIFVNLLIDARRGVKDPDKLMLSLLITMSINFQIIFTKSDAISDTKSLIHNTKLDLLSTFNINPTLISLSYKDPIALNMLRNNMILIKNDIKLRITDKS